jgi:hypothetical protein
LEIRNLQLLNSISGYTQEEEQGGMIFRVYLHIACEGQSV